jgi:hypothetical protein
MMFKRVSFCAECKHAFKPWPKYSRHAELCEAHRTPVIAAEDEMLAYLEWAKCNFERFNKIRKEEQAKQEEASRDAFIRFTQGQLNAHYNQPVGLASLYSRGQA